MQSALFRRNEGPRTARQIEEELERSPGNGQLWLRHAEACLRENQRAIAARSYARAAEIFDSEGHKRRAEVARSLARETSPGLSLVKPVATPACEPEQVPIDADPTTRCAAAESQEQDPFESVQTDVEVPGPNDVTVRVTCVFDLSSLRPREEAPTQARRAQPRRKRSRRLSPEITEVDIDIEALEAVGGSFED